MYKEKIIQMLKSPALADIWTWSKKSHWAVFWICILNLIVSGCSLVITVATRGLIDGATAHMSSQIRFYAIVMILTVLVGRGAYLLSGLLSVKTGAVLLKDIRSMLLHELMKKQYASLNGYHSGELVNRMFSDVSVVKNGILDIVPGLVSMTVSFVGAAVILISMDWRFVVVLIAGGAFGMFLLLAFRRPMKTRHKAVQESEGRLHAFLQETLQNLRLVKASVSEERMERQAAQRQENYMEMQLKKGYFASYISMGVNLVFQLGWLFCMLWGCFGIYQGHLTYGMFAAIIQLVGQIQGPIASAAGVAGQAYSTISSAERLKELFDLPEEKDCKFQDRSILYKQLSEIRIENMSFSYGREEQDVLEHVNCSIKPGDFVAVTGISGGGKSTLFQLLLGIYQPCKGRLHFCFQSDSETMVQEAASRKTRVLFAYVPQGNTLFSGTLRENFTMFTEDTVTDEQIWQAARLACIDSLIEKLDKGLDTVIGERGVGLSEGQAQRVAVARALMTQAPILLLDESTSALDEETEATLLKNISSLKDRTCLIVTHRAAALQICDYRIHIKNGNARICVLEKTQERK
ncbi:MAG: ABC transporter ATP-binding protein [Eubacteriales bacterium]|nr:ABC transporter ATP-binding protein [Eubacteriales bacterium]